MAPNTHTHIDKPEKREDEDELRMISHSEVRRKLGYGSHNGFAYFLEKTEDFPRPIHLPTGRIVFIGADVDRWIKQQREARE